MSTPNQPVSKELIQKAVEAQENHISIHLWMITHYPHNSYNGQYENLNTALADLDRLINNPGSFTLFQIQNIIGSVPRQFKDIAPTKAAGINGGGNKKNRKRSRSRPKRRKLTATISTSAKPVRKQLTSRKIRISQAQGAYSRS